MTSPWFVSTPQWQPGSDEPAAFSRSQQSRTKYIHDEVGSLVCGDRGGWLPRRSVMVCVRRRGNFMPLAQISGREFGSGCKRFKNIIKYWMCEGNCRDLQMKCIKAVMLRVHVTAESSLPPSNLSGELKNWNKFHLQFRTWCSILHELALRVVPLSAQELTEQSDCHSGCHRASHRNHGNITDVHRAADFALEPVIAPRSTFLGETSFYPSLCLGMSLSLSSHKHQELSVFSTQVILTGIKTVWEGNGMLSRLWHIPHVQNLSWKLGNSARSR